MNDYHAFAVAVSAAMEKKRTQEPKFSCPFCMKPLKAWYAVHSH